MVRPGCPDAGHDALVGELGRGPGRLAGLLLSSSDDQRQGRDRHDGAGNPATVSRPEALSVSRMLLVAAGEAITDIGFGTTTLARLDGLQVPAGEMVALRNNGPEPLRLLWVDYVPS